MGLTNRTKKLLDVCIIGMGPTGAVLSALLGQMGLQVGGCDARTDVYDKPRAIALDQEYLRVF